jgi:starch-binding outer membrane protein, SusD/RagB family
MKNILKYTLIIATIATMSSCAKQLEYDLPPNQIEYKDYLVSETALRELLTGAYEVLGSAMNGKTQNFNELLSDNLKQPLNNNDLTEIFNRNTLIFNRTIRDNYTDLYRAIFRANYIIDNSVLVPNLSSEAKASIEAECKFIRAFAHFELAKMYAQPYGYSPSNNHLGIILRKTAAFSTQPRSTVAETYSFIESDLQEALVGLGSALNGFHANVYSAHALLSQVYFLKNEYQNAANEIDIVVNSGLYQLTQNNNRFKGFGLVPLPEDSTVFIPGNIPSESILCVVSENSSINKSDGFSSNYRTSTTSPPQFSLSNEIYDLFQLKAGPSRDSLVINLGTATDPRYGLTKFDQAGFHVPILHLTQLLLTRAECLALLNSNLATAVSDINQIRTRAFGVGQNQLSSSADAAAIRDAARDERRIEMVGEGDWITQLKRRGAAGEIVIIRDYVWNCSGQVLQFHSTENTDVFEFNPPSDCN